MESDDADDDPYFAYIFDLKTYEEKAFELKAPKFECEASEFTLNYGGKYHCYGKMKKPKGGSCTTWVIYNYATGEF